MYGASQETRATRSTAAGPAASRTELGRAVHAARPGDVPLLRASRDAPFAAASAGTRRSATVAGAARRIAPSTARTRSRSTSPASCSPRTTTRSTSSRRASSGRTTSTRTRGCACRARSRATTARSAATARRPPTPTWTLADCLLLLGSNTAACHPIVWGRIRDRQAQGATVIVADPRATPTAAGGRPAPAGAAGHRPAAAQRDAARHRARRPARRAVRRGAHRRVRGGARGRARVAGRAGRGGLRRARGATSSARPSCSARRAPR